MAKSHASVKSRGSLMRDDIEDETLHCIRDYSGALGRHIESLPERTGSVKFCVSSLLKACISS